MCDVWNLVGAEDPLEGPSTSGYSEKPEKEAAIESLKRQGDETPAASTKKIKVLQSITSKYSKHSADLHIF